MLLLSLLVFCYWVLSKCLGMDIPVRPILGPLRPEAAKVGRDTGELQTRSAEIHLATPQSSLETTKPLTLSSKVYNYSLNFSTAYTLNY